MIRRIQQPDNQPTQPQAPAKPSWGVSNPTGQKEAGEVAELKKQLDAKNTELHATATKHAKTAEEATSLKNQLAAAKQEIGVLKAQIKELQAPKESAPTEFLEAHDIAGVEMVDSDHFTATVKGSDGEKSGELDVTWKALRALFQTVKSLRKKAKVEDGD